MGKPLGAGDHRNGFAFVQAAITGSAVADTAAQQRFLSRQYAYACYTGGQQDGFGFIEVAACHQGVVRAHGHDGIDHGILDG